MPSWRCISRPSDSRPRGAPRVARRAGGPTCERALLSLPCVPVECPVCSIQCYLCRATMGGLVLGARWRVESLRSSDISGVRSGSCWNGWTIFSYRCLLTATGWDVYYRGWGRSPGGRSRYFLVAPREIVRWWGRIPAKIVIVGGEVVGVRGGRSGN